MPMRIEAFSAWTAFRKSATSAEEETETLSAVVFLYGSPVAESKSWNQTRGEGGEDMEEDCCCGLDAIFTCAFEEKKKLKNFPLFQLVDLFKCRHPLYKIFIDRPPEIVKAVFMDWPRYPLWNPFITSLSLSKGDIDHPSSFHSLN
jgi:hypothetical protein